MITKIVRMNTSTITNKDTITAQYEPSRVHTVIPKKIEKYGNYFNYRQLTATAIMNVLKQNFPNDFIPSGCQTFVYINKKSTKPDNFAKPGRDSCTVEVVAISMGNTSTSDDYQLITPSELTMLFNCGTLH